MEKEAKMYEVAYFFSPLVPEDRVSDEVNNMRSAIEVKQGIVIYEDKPKMQRLAYVINKFDSGYFGLIKFMIDPAIISSLKDDLDKNDKIIRFVISVSKVVARKPLRARRPVVVKHKEEKESIKLEEIDRRLEEILKE
ncbi:MAG: 30S ribosomal protein S6 [Patescibacteria group bacterium]|mgnify:FL=1